MWWELNAKLYVIKYRWLGLGPLSSIMASLNNVIDFGCVCRSDKLMVFILRFFFSLEEKIIIFNNPSSWLFCRLKN